MAHNVKLEPGDHAPDFELPIAGGGTWALSDALKRAEKRVIVYFYPRAMTPSCTKEACDFRDAHANLIREGYEVIGVSPDPVARVKKFVDKESLNFPLACDENREVMRAYGAFGEKKNYGKIAQGVIRSTFVINKDDQIVSANTTSSHSGSLKQAI